MQNWDSYIFDETIHFEEKALQVFQYQYEHNEVYHRFCETLNVTPGTVSELNHIPLYPVRGFKEVSILTDKDDADSDVTFKSSGTSDMRRSIHRIKDPEIYRKSILKGIRNFYNLDEMVIWACTPGYNENRDSSLIWMLNTLIEQDETGLSRYLPVDEQIQLDDVKKVQEKGKKILLFGAAFGLMDYLENHESVRLPRGSIVMETGGMKTHRREMSREYMHKKLAKGFGVDRLQVHSEYGMTEMLSQAYAQGGAWFTSVPWLRIITKDPAHPRQSLDHYEEGLLGVIDLANVHSCSFLLTGDKGQTRKDGKFQIFGRWNPDNLRGCNFLVDYE